MRIAYIIAGGFGPDDHIDVYYAICHSAKRAEELCLQAENEDTSGRMYNWYIVNEEED